MDKRLQAKIQELVSAGVNRVGEMKRHLELYTKTVLFSSETLPPATDTRFWPKNKAIINSMYRVRVANRYAEAKIFGRNKMQSR
jgi:predicted chitinase